MWLNISIKAVLGFSFTFILLTLEFSIRFLAKSKLNDVFTMFFIFFYISAFTFAPAPLLKPNSNFYFS